MQNNSNCIGENRDTTYIMSTAFCLDADPQAHAAACGVNHEATGKATYANLSVCAYPKLQGIGGVNSSDPDEFTGLAREYLGSEYPASGHFLFAHKIARECAGAPYCLPVPVGRVDAQHNQQIEKGRKVFVGFRTYLEKKTDVSPAHAEILYDQVIPFSPSGVPSGECVACP